MRYAVKSEEVYHLWASQVQSHAYSGNISFKGVYAYSYAQVIGEVVTREDGEVGYLVNANARRSSTTCGHVSALRRAIPGYKSNRTWTVPLGNNPGDIFQLQYLLNEIAKYAAKAKRARSNKSWMLDQIPGMIAAAKEFAVFFGITDVVVPDTAEEVTGLTTQILEAERVKAAARQEELRIENERRYAAGKVEWETEVLPAWLAGGTSYQRNCQGYYDPNAYMRVRDANGAESFVETTQGARVSLSEVKAIAPRLLTIFDSGKNWTNAHDIKLGGYHVQGIADGVLTVGCHKFTEAEVRRFAAVIADL